MKKKTVFQKYDKFCKVSLEYFIKHKPLILKSVFTLMIITYVLLESVDIVWKKRNSNILLMFIL